MIFVDEPQVRAEGNHSTVSAKCHALDGTYDLWYKTESDVNPTSDTFLISTLIPAMKWGESLHVKGEISPRLLSQIPTIQHILHSWYSELKRVEVKCEVKPTSAVHRGTKVACFFSGGVDSFYTLLKHIDEITTIVYIRGFDVGVDERDYLDMMSREVKKMADEMGKELVEVETNIHVFGDRCVDWSFQYHGSALGSVASLLSAQIGKIYVPSSYSYKDIFPWGTHPLLDSLWSTEMVEMVHDGCEASRIEKMERIVSSTCALRYLRVCTDRESGRYNCSDCEKCIRTMIGLYAFGALNKCPNFRGFISVESLDAISNLKLNEHNIIFQRENYGALPPCPIKDRLKVAIDNFDRERKLK